MEALHRIYGRARLDDRLVNELIGLCHGLLADGTIDQGESQFLLRWVESNRVVTANPLVNAIYQRLTDMLHDNKLDDDEQKELVESIVAFVGGAPMPDGVNYATTLPITRPEPGIALPGARFCFTGTFAFGTRSECEAAVIAHGASAGGLTIATDYLVIGVYATDSWAHSSYGRKIEKAVEMRNSGHPIAIVGEQHWLSHL